MALEPHRILHGLELEDAVKAWEETAKKYEQKALLTSAEKIRDSYARKAYESDRIARKLRVMISPRLGA